MMHLASTCVSGMGTASPIVWRSFATSAAAAAGTKVGFIGLGHMGSRMVQHLLGSGHDLVVSDSNRLAMSRITQVTKGSKGSLETRDLPADISSDPDVSVVFTMLPSADAVRAVYLGEKGLFKASNGVTAPLYADCSTVDPSTARKVAEAAAKTKLSPKATPLPGLSTSTATFVDAPVSGGVVGADAGSLSFMAGGDKAAVDILKPYLQSMGTHVTYCGGNGTGSAARLCNTLVVGASMAAVSEALALGRRLGLQPETLTDVLNNSSGRCWSSERYNPVPGIVPDVPASKGYKGGLPTDFVHKQLEMLISAAEAAHSPVPVAKRMKELYEHIHDEGLGDKDFSSIFRYVYGQGCDNVEWKEGQQLFSSQVP